MYAELKEGIKAREELKLQMVESKEALQDVKDDMQALSENVTE